MNGPLFSHLYRDLKATRPWDHPIWACNHKLDARAFVEGLGVRVPELIAGPDELSAMHRWRLPERSVVKPNSGAVALGVLPLRKVGDIIYRSLLGDGTREWFEWVAFLHTVASRRPRTFPHPDNIRGPWFAEELIEGPKGGLPDEWKCYVIGGRVQFVAQFRRDPATPRVSQRSRTCYRDRDLRPIPGGVKSDRAQHNLPGPRDPAGIIALAETVAQALPAPFVRLDVYEDAHGPVFSEITPEPGGNHDAFLPHWDRMLGEAWTEAVPV